MGIKNLTKFLRETTPDVFEPIHLSEYAYKKVAIDTSLYMCLYKASNEDRWLSAFIRLIECLRYNNIHCVFIFDTKAPPEKELERKNRSDSKGKQQERIFIIENALERFHSTSEIDPVLFEFQKKRKLELKSIMKQRNTINIKGIQACLDKMKKQNFSVSEKDFMQVKELFNILDVPYFQAPMEAETTCSDLCRKGLVDAVLTRDSDVLAYACPIFLTDLSTDTGICYRLQYDKILEALDVTTDQFLDFCILCGTDYNSNIFKLGPKKAFALIKTYGTIENIEENTSHDISVLKHVRVRELFKNYEQVNYYIPYCGKPDFRKLNVFLVKNNITISHERLEKSFSEVELTFEKEEEDEGIEIEIQES